MEHIFIAIGVILLIFIIWYIVVLNKLNRTIIKIEEALSGIDIALTKRYDVITKMVEVVKGYTKHEKETLFKIIKMRENLSLPEKSSLNKAMDENMQKVNIVVEKYPDLKGVFGTNESSTIFALEALQKTELAGKVALVGFDISEEQIAAIR